MPAWRLLTSLMILAVLCVSPGEAQQAKKKAMAPREGAAGDRDGKEDVRGAIWEVTAVKVEPEDEKSEEKTDSADKGAKKKGAKAKTKQEEEPKQEVFRFRHQTGVVYNLKGEKIGAISAVNADPKLGVKSRLVLNKSTPLIGEMVMTQTKIGVWGGVFKTKTDEEWNCVVKVLDR